MLIAHEKGIAVVIKVYATLRLKIGQAEIHVSASHGDTVRDAVGEMLAQFPTLTPFVLSNEEELADHVNILVNGRNIRLLDGLDTVIEEGQRLDIFPPIAGGTYP